MARHGGGMLPAISGGEMEVWQSPRVGRETISRVEVLEDRLSRQEKTTQSLLDRAYRVKEDIIDNLNITHGTWQEEKQARELLQEHIRTITDVVRKLNSDIQSIDGQIRQREGASDGAQTAVRSLEVQHVTGLSDLRGRVARCDAAIARLAADSKTSNDSIRQLSLQQQQQEARLNDKLKSLDSKLNDVLSRLDHSTSEYDLHLRHLEGDTNQQLEGINQKTQIKIEDTRQLVKNYQQSESVEREKMQTRLESTVDRQLLTRDSKLDKIERRVEESLSSINKHIHKLEGEVVRGLESNKKVQESLESRLAGQLDNQARRQNEDLHRLKRECREGFSTVHESITSMKQVMDGKRKLLEEQLRKELSQIRKMVVLI